MERETANEALSTQSPQELYAFLQGNWSPILDYATYCDDQHLPVLIEAIFTGILLSDEPENEIEDISALITGWEIRFGSTLPPAIRTLLTTTITKALCRMRQNLDVQAKDV